MELLHTEHSLPTLLQSGRQYAMSTESLSEHAKKILAEDEDTSRILDDIKMEVDGSEQSLRKYMEQNTNRLLQRIKELPDNNTFKMSIVVKRPSKKRSAEEDPSAEESEKKAAVEGPHSIATRQQMEALDPMVQFENIRNYIDTIRSIALQVKANIPVNNGVHPTVLTSNECKMVVDALLPVPNEDELKALQRSFSVNATVQNYPKGFVIIHCSYSWKASDAEDILDVDNDLYLDHDWFELFTYRQYEILHQLTEKGECVDLPYAKDHALSDIKKILYRDDRSILSLITTIDRIKFSNYLYSAIVREMIKGTIDVEVDFLNHQDNQVMQYFGGIPTDYKPSEGPSTIGYVEFTHGWDMDPSDLPSLSTVDDDVTAGQPLENQPQ